MFNDPVDSIPSVGEKTKEQLALLNISKVGDLLFHFPFRYDFFELKPLKEINHEEVATIQGEIVSEPSVSYFGRKKSRLTCTVQVGVVAIKAIFFNQAFLKDKLKRGESVTLTGKWDMHRLQLTVQQLHPKSFQEDQTIQPVYHTRANLSTKQIKKLVSYSIKSSLEEIVEMLPEKYLTDYKLPNRQQAIKSLHQPSSKTVLKHARRRFIFEELFIFQLKMQWIKAHNKKKSEGISKTFDQEKIKAFISRLSFDLTDSQKRVLEEILDDLRSQAHMNRLLQGDVGSGKTVVAAIALYATHLAGQQGALMVPTEILAEQHEQSLKELFGELLNIELLTGSIKGKKREEKLERIEKGEVDLVVGTHALIQEDTVFNDIGLVIVDEQHRFGVEQRKTLRDKGIHPDVLFMTATPIPRTLSITSFGDMDVSIIDEMPKGRKAIDTFWVKENMLDRVHQFIISEVQNGHQAYVICPLIEESDKLDIQNAVDVYEQLQSVLPQDIQVGLMHGRLSSQEKDDVMRDYADNEIQVLVSTTVVEVGVNVPNATIMVIYDAERFGLAQLHQLRGRVGRGQDQSYCILLADPKGDTGKERMRVMTETNDGFTLSEHDLQIRGPGDFFGKKQSGLPEFKVANIVDDYRALEVARRDAVQVMRENLLETDPEYVKLREMIESDPKIQERIFD
ncbi:ATP-dependent DNA helicase RecG [Tenuibacillus multivorans]|uniref:ATP-dependent DNA helicase RecG n=1 Tax=Tenuibacillus multivorans TaxID=237069 RepID=A0A1G9Y379_9BACI|nr:ATP-dependent DNA helicase RecG [Tenuibacillus multivorans]GEL75914.1 ATP-dependent DNA helicase RecG [Tenuibacillus multivorans]SDN03061.1 ATP-dependent DNA helicase RecG [Tenuibacillus multivorans]